VRTVVARNSATDTTWGYGHNIRLRPQHRVSPTVTVASILHAYVLSVFVGLPELDGVGDHCVERPRRGAISGIASNGRRRVQTGGNGSYWIPRRTSRARSAPASRATR